MNYIIIDRFHVKDINGNWIVDGTEWNPESNREWWDKIWAKMDFDMIYVYVDRLDYFMDWKKLEAKQPKLQGKHEVWFGINTASPKICWKALIATLNQINQEKQIDD